ncbi:hypothetical protein RJT34_31963 [Clitoria ternatea]|uniref:TF-B3 domain-containing protein n=1 Tax=Clitoria ternatea TaxID=43366 RepID=A0AAN9I8X9_CLITE
MSVDICTLLSCIHSVSSCTCSGCTGLSIILDNNMTTAAKKYPDFFKVFLPEQHSERMLIPIAWVTCIEGGIPEDVKLRNRNGRVWYLKTQQIGDKLYFDDGWKTFWEENSLEDVAFLTFEYDGSNEFKFIILDTSTQCEKPMVIEEDEDREEESEDDDSDDDDYDDNDAKMEEENEDRRWKCHCKVGKREAATSPTTKIEDLLLEAEIYMELDSPHFYVKQHETRPNELHVPGNVIKALKHSFPKKITFSCCQCKGIERHKIRDYHQSQQTHTGEKYLEVAGEVHKWKDGRVCVKGWAEFCRKNKIKKTDACICEIVFGEDLGVKMFLVHVC